MKNTYGVIGMSPGNSYFKQGVIDQILEKALIDFNGVGIFIADVPAISTYIALGYPENRARREKAIPQGNALKNKVKNFIARNPHVEQMIRIFNWKEESIDTNPNYKKYYQAVRGLYEDSLEFKKDCNEATRQVLIEHSLKKIEITEREIEIAVHYLLSEFAFMLFLPFYIGQPRVAYVYHRPWPVFEKFVQGNYDGIRKEGILFVQYPDFS